MKIPDYKAIEIFGDGLVLTSDFWDCECETNFIHAREEDSCVNCNCYREEQPDSRVNEVFYFRQTDLSATQLQVYRTALRTASKIVLNNISQKEK